MTSLLRGARHGCRAIAVVGGATALVGDPSGRDTGLLLNDLFSSSSLLSPFPASPIPHSAFLYKFRGKQTNRFASIVGCLTFFCDCQYYLFLEVSFPCMGGLVALVTISEIISAVEVSGGICLLMLYSCDGGYTCSPMTCLKVRGYGQVTVNNMSAITCIELL